MRLIAKRSPGQMRKSKRGKAPLIASPKFGEVPVGRRGCTIVQVENELKGKLIPGELPRRVRGE